MMHLPEPVKDTLANGLRVPLAPGRDNMRYLVQRYGSWRVLKPKPEPEWKIQINEHQRGVSVKGNTYFFAHDRFVVIDDFGYSVLILPMRGLDHACLFLFTLTMKTASPSQASLEMSSF
ncbi:hypothetical protein Bca4012_101568 [Brassica carinata]